uniref:Protein kinase domain-containing protein n=1 Tax=Onchocerca volvulus TaxID=6282 RepID=A0A8R1XQL2_ONCVO
MAPELEQLSPCTSNGNDSNEHSDDEATPEILPDILYEPHNFRHYTPTLYLGKGGFARCYAAKDSSSTMEVALKIVPRSRLTRHSQLEKMRKEIAIHQSLNHPNVVKFLNCFEDNINVYMVLELCHNGTLLYRIQNAPGGRLRDISARMYLLQIVDAVIYLHEQVGILHRDLKPGNVLLSSNDQKLKLQVKLADFGLALKLNDLPYYSLNVCGTPNYLSPQVLKREGHSKESEAWSIGCILYCMLIGKPPFEADTLEKTYAKITSCDYSFPLKPKICISAEDLISKLLIPDMKVRIKIDAVKCHPYLGNKDNLGLVANLKNQKKKQTNKQMPLTVFPELKGFGEGCSISDSGIGSEGGLNARPRSISDCKTLYKQLLLGYYAVSDEALRPLDFQLNVVSKWVDYTNKYGFGCVLSDGTHCTLFVDNSSISRRHIPMIKLNFFFKSNVIINVCKVIYCINYMDKELQPVYEHSTVRQQLDALVYQKRRSGVLLMFLALGTIQINFLESHEKLVISRDEYGRLLLTMIDRCVGFHMYQLLPCASTPIRPKCQKVQQLLQKACQLLEGEKALLPRTCFATQC